MIVLCLDIGTQRTGVAISDPTGTLARPLTTLQVGGDLVAMERELRALVSEHGVERLVVGLPRRLSGAHGPEAERAEALAVRLGEALDLPVRLHDERLTTVEAERLLSDRGVHGRKRRQRVDQVAAAVILQAYLDRDDGPAMPPDPA